MNGVILYQSKYGATKKYAMWLSDETGFSLVETKRAKIEDIEKFDTIILGGGVYASGSCLMTGQENERGAPYSNF